MRRKKSVFLTIAGFPENELDLGNLNKEDAFDNLIKQVSRKIKSNKIKEKRKV